MVSKKEQESNEYVSISEFARRKNVKSRAAVYKAIENGRIHKEENGSINWAKESQSWDDFRDPSKVRGEEEAGNESFQNAKAKYEFYKAKLKELEYSKKSGEVVNKTEVRQAISDYTSSIRNGIETLPTRVAATNASKLIIYFEEILIPFIADESLRIKIINSIDPSALESIERDSWETDGREILVLLTQGCSL